MIPDESDALEYQNFGRMVQWVLDNRERENIDFVLHVGDAIAHGPPMPLDASCFEGGRCLEAGCNCEAFAAVPVEWARFDAQWRRLDHEVPYAIVRGNHDNTGIGDPESPSFTEGFSQHYGLEQMRGLPSYHASYPGADDTAHVWVFDLGPERVVVIGMSHRPGLKQIVWARGVLSDPELSGLPVIMLAHQFFLGLPIRYDKPTPSWEIVVDNAERIPIAVWGHIAPGKIDVVDIRGHATLRIRTNWQGSPTPIQSRMNLMRFYMGPDSIEQVEVLAFSPIYGFSGAANTRLARQAFTLR